jgi:tetratricopeptide (TPR) repeat protein
VGFFDFIFGRPTPVVADPELLKRLLFDAVKAGDQRKLAGLCRGNEETIRTHFPQWRKVPEPLLGQSAEVQRYVQALLTVAQHFADRLGKPDLLQLLLGNQQSNPLHQWHDRLESARKLMAELRYPEAIQALSDLLIDFRGLQGSGVDRFLPITFGRLGECYFDTGQAEKAIGPFAQALKLCEQHGDTEGIGAYRSNLYEAHRYLEQREAAAQFAERLADFHARQGRDKDAERFRSQASLVRAGEPKNRVVAVVDGHRHELSNVPPIKEGRLQFVFERDRITLRPATVQTQRGEELAKQGKYDEALGLFRAAAQADRFDPHSRYLQGLTLLHLERYTEAVECYESVEELAPGWFRCRADLWLAQELAMGRLDQEVFTSLLLLEDGPAPPAEKLKLAEAMLPRMPKLAVLHLQYGQALARLGRRTDAATAYLKGLSSGDEPDTKTRLLVELALVSDSPTEKIRLLQEARQLNGNLVAAATAAVILRGA